jgi:hypothetical protein
MVSKGSLALHSTIGTEKKYLPRKNGKPEMASLGALIKKGFTAMYCVTWLSLSQGTF